MSHSVKLKMNYTTGEYWFMNLWACIAIAPMLISEVGFRFVVSPVWASAMEYIGLALGVISAVGGLMICIQRSSLPVFESIKTIFHVFVFVPVFMFIAGWMFVIAGIPMFITIFMGGDTKLTLEVSDPHAIGYRYCKHAVSFEEAPIPFARICKVPEDTRNRLRSGDVVDLPGWGTNLGIFVGDTDYLRKKS